MTKRVGNYYPINIKISSLVEAASTKQFAITWDYNAPTKNDKGVRFILQRYISDYPVDQSHDIICKHDYVDKLQPEYEPYELKYNFCTLSDGITGMSYIDSLGSTGNLDRHGRKFVGTIGAAQADNGHWADMTFGNWENQISWDGTTWRDKNNRDIVDDILTGKRQIYYRLVAFDRYANFNMCPFWYVGYDDCWVEGHSTISQVKSNVRYLEGDLYVYGDFAGAQQDNNTFGTYTGTSMGIRTLAVDIQHVGSSRIFWGDYRNDRCGNIWLGTGLGWAAQHCLNTTSFAGIAPFYPGYTAWDDATSIHSSTTRIIGNAKSAVIDPYWGDLIVAYENTTYPIRCNYDTIHYNSLYGDPVDIQGPLGMWTDFTSSGSSRKLNGSMTLYYHTPHFSSYVVCITNDNKDIDIWHSGGSKANYLYNDKMSNEYTMYQPRIAFESHPYAVDAPLAGICTAAMPTAIPTQGVPITPLSGKRGDYPNSMLSPPVLNVQGTFVNTYLGQLVSPTEYKFKDIGIVSNQDAYMWIDEFNLIPPGALTSDQFTTCQNRHSFPCGPNSTPTRTHYSMTGDLYPCSYIWITNPVEGRVDVIGPISGTATAPFHPEYLGSITVAGCVDVCVDSENSIWCTSDQGRHLKRYNLRDTTDSTEFPHGYNCRWPSDIDSETSWPYGQWKNDKYIEYVLSRDPFSMASDAQTAWFAMTAAYDGWNSGDHEFADLTGHSRSLVKAFQTEGVCITGSVVEQRVRARSWYNTYCHPSGPNYNSINQTGMRVYPHATFDIASWVVPRKHTRYLESIPGIPHVLTRNSDSTGAKARIAAGSWPSIPRIFSPSYTYPEVSINITPNGSTPMLNDATYWNDQSVTSSYNISGYDDLDVNIEAYVSNNNSFDAQECMVYFGDKPKDIGGSVNPVSAVITLPGLISYTYHDPSQSGKPGYRRDGNPGTSTGYYNICASVAVSNPYLLYGTVSAGNGVVSITGLSGETDAYNNIVNTINVSKTVTVWERWPTAKMYAKTFDLPISLADSIWGYSSNGAAGANTTDLTSPTRIVSGSAPLSAQFTDYSIARTWPLCAWHFNFGDSNGYPAQLPSSLVALTGSKYNGLTTMHLITTSDTFHPRDSQTYHYDFAEHVYTKPGTYYATLYVQASNTSTESATTDGTMTCAVTCEILVIGSCPNAHILISSANTVSSNYSYDGFVYPPTGLTNAYISPNRMYVSGYAPYLTVTFLDSSVPTTVPISSYYWDFNDWYAGWATSTYSAISTVNMNTLLSGEPYWTTDKTNHTTEYTYIYPGLYIPTLNVYTSGELTPSCEVATVSVYVEELPPTACFEIGLSATSFGITNVSGVSPLTLYFNPSCTIEGSFPICQIDWDFGDGSPILSVTRYPSAEVFIGPIAYPDDPADPRNVIVSHTYVRSTSSDPYQFNVQITVYACGTDTTNQTPSGSISSFDVTIDVSNPNNNGDPNWLLNNMNIDNLEHLVANRVFDTNNNNVIVFEGQIGTAYNYLLSGN